MHAQHRDAGARTRPEGACDRTRQSWRQGTRQPDCSEKSEGARRPRSSTAADGRFRVSEQSRGDRIRTCGLLLPKQALYQAELHPVCGGRTTSAAGRREYSTPRDFTSCSPHFPPPRPPRPPRPSAPDRAPPIRASGRAPSPTTVTTGVNRGRDRTPPTLANFIRFARHPETLPASTAKPRPYRREWLSSATVIAGNAIRDAASGPRNDTSWSSAT